MARKTKAYVKAPTVGTFEDVNQELFRVQEAFDTLSEHLATEVTANSPDKIVNLQVRYADGTNWNPGKGEGLYINIDGVWKKIAFDE